MSLINENVTPPILLPCNICNRTFKPDSLSKHAKVCEKSLMKKRKKFDSSKQRIQGTDLAEFLPLLSKTSKSDRSPNRKVDCSWKVKHLELMETIHAARQVPSNTNSNCGMKDRNKKLIEQEACPYCDRSFGPKAYDRHIEWCREKTSRILPKSTASVMAKERLEARTKYQAPKLRQSLRARTREKYSPQRYRQLLEKKQDSTNSSVTKESLSTSNKETSSELSNKSQVDSCKPMVSVSNVSAAKTKDIPSKPAGSSNKSGVNLSTQPISKRLSTNNRLGPTQLKKLDPSITSSPKTPAKVTQKQSTNTQSILSDSANYDPFTSAERQMKELLGLDFDQDYPNLKELPSPIFNPSPLIRKLKAENSAEKLLNNSKPVVKVDINIRKIKNSVDRKNSFNKSLSSSSSDSQLSQEPCESILVQSKIDNIDSLEELSDRDEISPTNDLVIKDPVDADLKRTPVSIGCSPTSAFAKYSPSPSLSDNGENFENKINEMVIEKSIENVDKYPHINMSNLSLCSTVSIDSNIDFNKNKRGSNDSAFVPETACKTSKSSEGRNIGRTLLNMEQMLFGVSNNVHNNVSNADNKNNNRKNSEQSCNRSVINKNKMSSLKIEKGNPDFNQLYPKISSTEAAELELLESMSELENLYLFFPISQDPTPTQNITPSKSEPNPVMDGSGEGLHKEKKETQSALSYLSIRKPSSDSAYSSLNRKSPVTKSVITHQIDLSDIKSPSSLSSSGSESSVAQACRTERRLSTFCHECGAKYPVSVAKFCCECGVRRLALS